MLTYHSPCCPFPFPRRLRVLFAISLIAMALAAGALGSVRAAQAATITVTTTADEYNTGPGCSLREAIRAANTDVAFGGCPAGAGADTITFGVNGTFLITITPGPDENADAGGDFDLLSDITIQGSGAANTIIDGGSADRVFDIAPLGGPALTVGFSGLTIQNGKAFSANFNVGGGIYIGSNATVTIDNSTLANNQSQANSGGGIENRGALTLNSVTMQNNTALALGGAVNSIGSLTANNSTFSGNRAESGGALYINTASTRTATITGSSFAGNQAVATAGGVADSGGAIAASTDGPVTISGSSFTGNGAAANGGAIYFSDAATEAAVAVLGLSYSRIAGNTATAGSGLYRASGTATAERNWWGCNGGPAATPCDLAAGGVSFSPWIVLTHTANPGAISPGQAATLTAGFLQNSDGSANAPGSLGALKGVGVTFGSAVLGTLANAQAAIQANGTATATYTAGATAGAGSATAGVDSATVTADLVINRLTTQVASLTLAGSSPGASGTVTWTAVFSDAIAGLSANNFDLSIAVPRPGSRSAPAPVGVSGSGVTWTVTTTVYSTQVYVMLSLVNDDGLDHALSNLPYFGESYIGDTDPPETVITAAPPNPSSSSTATFAFAGSDAGSFAAGFECQLDGGAFTQCTSPVEYSNLADGSHTFAVRAVDFMATIDPTPALYTWTVAVGGSAIHDRLYLPLLQQAE